MSTHPKIESRPAQVVPNGTGDAWRANARVMLQPVAAPSILGLFGFAAATFIVAAHIAGWYGNATSPQYLFPFAAFFGGVAQFMAGMWSYRARDGLATAMHGMWGSFWMAYGLLFLLNAVGALTIPATGAFPELGYWFLTLCAITAAGALASLAETLGLTAVLTTLSVGSGLLAVGYLTGGSSWLTAGGWVLIASAVCAFYTASALMLEGTWGRVVLPLGKLRKAANLPGGRITDPIEYAAGEPGVRHGQ
jgi:uncharacterized protein